MQKGFKKNLVWENEILRKNHQSKSVIVQSSVDSWSLILNLQFFFSEF